MASEIQILANRPNEQESDSPPNKPPISPNLPTIYNLFMQNKANFRKSQVNVNLYNTTDYENKSDWTLGENEPKTNPIKANLKRAQMNVNSLITKDYRKKDDFAVKKNKPNSKPICQRVKLMQSVYLQRIMKKNADSGYEKTKPKQTQSKPISVKKCQKWTHEICAFITQP
jgi:hypothetical protein